MGVLVVLMVVLMVVDVVEDEVVGRCSVMDGVCERGWICASVGLTAISVSVSISISLLGEAANATLLY